MALAVASTSSASGNNTGSLTITAPTGITTGDLLIIVTEGYNSTSTPSGFTEIAADSYSRGSSFGTNEINVYYKIAVLADESAPSYTVNYEVNSDAGGAAAMLRITGWVSGNPLYDYVFNDHNIPTGSPNTVSASSLTIKRPSQQILLMATSMTTDGSSGTASVSGYSITSSDSNPTWTEAVDAAYTCYGNTNTKGRVFSLAYATSSNTSDITAYQSTITDTYSDSYANGGLTGLFVIVEPVNETGTHSLLTPNTEFFTNQGTSDASGTSALKTVSPTFLAPTSSGTGQTVWTGTTKS